MAKLTSFIVALSFAANIFSLPILQEDDLFDERGFFEDEPQTIINATDSGNVTVPKDLYVIRTIVYEVGILADVTNTTEESSETDEEVDLTFYNPQHNGSSFDLNDIPIPLQTNISGISVTGIAPANFGNLAFKNGHPVLNGAAIPNAFVEVKHNISTTSAEHGEELIRRLAPLLGLSSTNKTENHSTR